MEQVEWSTGISCMNEGEGEGDGSATAWVTVQGFMSRYNCGRNVALKYMNECPFTVKIAGKLQMPVAAFERHIKEEAGRQRHSAPNLIPEIQC